MVLLAAAHRGPHLDRLLGGVAAIDAVADDAADEARVGGEDALVVVDRQLGEGADVDAELLIGGDGRGQALVEAVVWFWRLTRTK